MWTMSCRWSTRKIKRVALIVYSSNSSLCGGFNSNVIKMMIQAVDEYKAHGIDDITVYPIGRKVAEKAQKLGLKIGGNFLILLIILIQALVPTSPASLPSSMQLVNSTRWR